jgi:NADPH-dependent ferric siderophore reductase
MLNIATWTDGKAESILDRIVPPIKVVAVEYLFKDLKRIVMEGDFRNIKYNSGNVIEFRVTDNDCRHYTVSSIDRENGICEMMVYLHDRGVGSKWIEKIKTGDKARILWSEGKMRYQCAHTKHFVFGDESSVGLMNCIAKEAQRHGHESYCIAELEDDHFYWMDTLGLQATLVEKEYDPPAKHAAASIAALDDYFWQQWHDAAFYLTGRAKSVHAIRKALIRKGIQAKNIYTEFYWAEGKMGL